MRLVLSRKGFDSANGCVPSPIFPDGRLMSLPIPWPGAPVTFAELGGGQVGAIVEDLTDGKVKATSGAHLDPDLEPLSLRRITGWRPAFGQMDAAQSHLAKLGVAPGDLFLFFGWFREVEKTSRGSWQYRLGASDRHVLFGWLQVGEVLPIPADVSGVMERRPWLADHPHVQGLAGRGNTVYVSSERLALNGVDGRGGPGAGVFRRACDDLILTKSGQALRSRWCLPHWFYPARGRKPLSYHADMTRWRRTECGAELMTVGRGQEFVLDCEEYPEAIPWVTRLIAEHGVAVARNP